MKKVYRQQEIFAQIVTALNEFSNTGDSFATKRLLRKKCGLKYNTASLRWKQALEVQKWLNENKIVIGRY